MDKKKTITKKHIVEVLRSRDLTKIFHLVHIINGNKTDKHEVFAFVKKNAPSDKVIHDIWWKMFIDTDRHFSLRDSRREMEFYNKNVRHEAIRRLREEIARGTDNYTKRPILGHTHLYFCSPFYGHRDYNKWSAMEIEGNERFCELIVKLADKYIPMSND